MRKKEKIRFLFCLLVFFAFCVCIPAKGYQEGLSDAELYGNGEENVLGHESTNRRNTTNQNGQVDKNDEKRKAENVKNTDSQNTNTIDNAGAREKEQSEIERKESTTESITESTTESAIKSEKESEKPRVNYINNELESTSENISANSAENKLADDSEKLISNYETDAKKAEVFFEQLFEQLTEEIQKKCVNVIDVIDLRRIVESYEGVSQCQIKINGQEVIEGVITKPGEYDVELLLTNANGVQDSTVVPVTIIEETESTSSWNYVIAIICVLLIGCILLICLKRKQQMEMEEKNVRKIHM